MISELLPEDKRRLYELELQLVELEKGNPNIHFSDLNLGLAEMSNRLDNLDKLANRESKNRRDDMKRRVQHLRTSYNHIKMSLENLLRKRGEIDFEAQKMELLGGMKGDSNRFDLESAENTSLNRSGRMLQEYIESGQETLSELFSQRERLKSIQRKVLDILSLLGVSNSIMRVVEKRENIDRIIVFLGMFFITLLLFVLYWYFKRK